MMREGAKVSCIRCGREVEDGDVTGCPICLEQGVPANFTVSYSEPFCVDEKKAGLLRYRSRLPVSDGIFLGEGHTPLVPLPNFSRETGIAGVYSKNEFQNPTGSHKDRMSALVIGYAREKGFREISVASSGNAGVSLAAYARAAGMGCRVVASRGMPDYFQQAVRELGGRLVLTSGDAERWQLLEQMYREEGVFPATNYLMPPCGSHYAGVEGYKTIAFELYEQLNGKGPDAIWVPTSRGDLLWGLYAGFRDLQAAGLVRCLPQLIAVEPFPRLAKGMEEEQSTGLYPGEAGPAFSIGGQTVTYQGMEALRRTEGFAVSMPEALHGEGWGGLAGDGLYLERSSSYVADCFRCFAGQGKVKEGVQVLISTSHGFKNYYAQP